MTASITCSFQFVIMANLISIGHQKMVDNQTKINMLKHVHLSSVLDKSPPTL